MWEKGARVPADVPQVWQIVLVCVAGVGASALTFFSGFGLGTLLMPVLAFFVPAPVAVGATAVVHLANNLFKGALMGRHADRGTLVRFGLPAVVTAFAGAWLLSVLSRGEPLASYAMGSRVCEITPVKLVLAAVVAGFAALELTPRFQKMRMPARWMPVGGALSGFFGGLSGHQGALRSAFLVRGGLSKEAFIGTGVVIACMVDAARLGVYGLGVYGLEARGPGDGRLLEPRVLWLVAPASAAALAGSLIGARLVKKVTLAGVRTIVGVLLLVVAVLLGAGVV